MSLDPKSRAYDPAYKPIKSLDQLVAENPKNQFLADRLAEQNAARDRRARAESWDWLPIYAVVGVAIPALIYWLMFRHWSVEGDWQSAVAGFLGFAGFGATIYIKQRF